MHHIHLRPRLVLWLITLVAAAVALTASAPTVGTDSSRASGPARTESRAVGSFDSVAVGNSVTLHVTIGGPPSVTVTAPADLLPHVLTGAKDDRLSIELDRTSKSSGSVRVDVTAPSLTAISASTSASASVDGVSTDALSIAADGASSIAVTGSASNVELRGTTAARIDLHGLAITDAHVDLGSSAFAELSPSTSLVGSVHESAEVRIVGQPARLEVVATTSGRITHG